MNIILSAGLPLLVMQKTLQSHEIFSSGVYGALISPFITIFDLSSEASCFFLQNFHLFYTPIGMRNNFELQ